MEPNLYVAWWGCACLLLIVTVLQVSTPLVYPTNMEFIINTQFIITGVGCGDYPYLCVEVAKADDPRPDFVLNNGGDPVVICQRVACNG